MQRRGETVRGSLKAPVSPITVVVLGVAGLVGVTLLLAGMRY
jgi:hypothetical protein